MFKRIRGIGGLLGPDYEKVLERAQKTRETGGPQAAIAFLRENLDAGSEKVAGRHLEGYINCRILLGQCLVESGLQSKDAIQVRDGVHALLELPKTYRNFMVNAVSLLPKLLGEVEANLRQALAPEGSVVGDKVLLQPEVAALGSMWNQWAKPQQGMQFCVWGLEVFPDDPNLRLVQAESLAGMGQLAECLAAVKGTVRATGEIQLPGMVLSVLELVDRAGNPVMSGAATALSAEVYHRLGRWDQVRAAARRAIELQGEAVEEPTILALLVAESRLGRVDEFVVDVERLMARSLGDAGVGVLLDEVRTLTGQSHDRADLLGVLLTLSLRAGQTSGAAEAVQKCLAVAPASAEDLAERFRTAGVYETVEPALCLSLAEVLYHAGRFEESLRVVLRLANLPAAAPELEAAAGRAQRILERLPGNLAVMDGVARLHLRRGGLEEALEVTRQMLGQPESTRSVAALCHEISSQAQLAGRHPLCLETLKLEIELRIKEGDVATALRDVRSLSQHPAATMQHLLWVAECLRRMTAHPAGGAPVRVLLGDILTRLVVPREAAEHYQQVLLQGGDARLTDQACAGLARVWSKAADPARARAVLARGWLGLGRPKEARGPLLECLTARQAEAGDLLALLRKQAEAAGGRSEWTALSFDAEIAYGEESRLAAVLESMGQWLTQGPENAGLVEQYARQVEEKTQQVPTRRAALLARARALVARRSIDSLGTLARSVVERDPTFRIEFIGALEQASQALGPEDRAAAAMVLGGLWAVGGVADAEKAVACYAQAAELDPGKWAEKVVAETCQVATRADGFPGAVLAALRAAIQLRQGAALASDLLKLLDRLSPAQLEEARQLMGVVLKEEPALPQVLIAAARCDLRLKRKAEAVNAYRQVCDLRAQPHLDLAVQDLRDLHLADPADEAFFLAYMDALLATGDTVRARDALLARLPQYPAEAAPCLARLSALERRPERTWEDGFAWAEAHRLAGRPAEAVPLWTKAIEDEAVDWVRSARALQQLWQALPRDFRVVVLLIRAEAQALAPEQLGGVLVRMEQALGLPERSPAILRELLGACERIETRGKGRDALAAAVAFQRSDVLGALGDHAGASSELDRLVRRWPRESAKVAARCVRWVQQAGGAVYQLPLARSRFIEGQFAEGVPGLREMVAAMPEQRGAARGLCQEYTAQASPEGWTVLQLFLAELAVQTGDLKRVAETCLEVAVRAPNHRPAVLDRLRSLANLGVGEPDVWFALADVELDGRESNLGQALEVVARFFDPDPAGRFDAVQGHVRKLAERFPAAIEPRKQLLAGLLRHPDPPAPVLARETTALLRTFGADGARAFLAICDGAPNGRLQEVLLPLECDAWEMLADIPRSLECLRRLAALDLARHGEVVRHRAESYRQRGECLHETLAFLADLARATGDYGRAAAGFAEAVEIPGADLGRIRMGLEDLLRADARNATACCALARCEWRAGVGVAAARCYRQAAGLGDGSGVAERLRELCAAFPETASCWFVRGEVAFGRGDFAEAFDSLQAALARTGLDTDERVRSWKLLTECFVRQGRFDDAIETIRYAVEAAPDDSEAARRVIDLYFERNNYQVNLARERLEREGATPALILEYAELLSARGDHSPAVEWFRKVPASDPLAARARLAEGKCQLALNDCNLGVAALRAALGAQPAVDERLEALYQLGIAHARLLEYEAAVAAFRELCQQDPGYRDAADHLRRCYEQAHGGDRMRLAEVDFDLVATWRRLGDGPATGQSPAPPVVPPAPDRP
jgi:tetratricopeptide (TPR) repeat protein